MGSDDAFLFDREHPATLGDAIPVEIARVREILKRYRAIGINGAAEAMRIWIRLRRMDDAVASGNVAAMIAAYKALQKITD